ncbi:MAG: hypothetical protein P4M07_19275 [Xanthobacteraceae bacterium]|nr:hypothetical protein [Xanthobacteraceae bacterium]
MAEVAERALARGRAFAAALRPVAAWLGSGWRPPALIALLLLVPLLYGSPATPGRNHFGLPRVHSGDEPHYLVQLNSLLRDGDLDLGNNYHAVERGDIQAGHDYAGWALDHHTVWFEGERRRDWQLTFEMDPAKWDSDGEGHPVPHLRRGQAPPAEGHVEISTHPAGLALMLAPLLYPLRGTDLMEPAAILCSALAVILAMLMYRALIRTYANDRRVVDLATAVTFLGTLAWHYGRTLYTEPYLLLFATAAYSLALRGRSPLLAGAMIGLAILMKPTFLLLAAPILAMYAVAQNYRAALAFALPLAAGVLATLAYDATMLGSPFRAVQEWKRGEPLAGAWLILFSLERGLLITVPAIVVALLAWPRFFRDHRRDALVLGAGVLLNYALFASYGDWRGGACYGLRYMAPVLPLLFTSLVSVPDLTWWRSPAFRGAVIAVCALSIAINARASIQYWKFWNTNPIYAYLRHNPA